MGFKKKQLPDSLRRSPRFYSYYRPSLWLILFVLVALFGIWEHI